MKVKKSFHRRAAGTAAFVLVCSMIFGIYYTRVAGEDLVPVGRGYEVQAVLPTVASLAHNADVREAGIKVGKVHDVRLVGDGAVVLLKFDDRHGPLRRDAHVLVREKTPTGEAYLEITSGSPTAPELPSGGTLRVEQAREYVSIDDVLSTFDPATRASLRRLLGGLDGGLHGRGDDLNSLFEATTGLVDEGAPVFRVLAEDRAAVGGFVDDFGRVMRALGDRKQDIGLLARQGRAAAETVAGRDRELGATLDELPGMLHQTQETTGRLASLSGRATPVVSDLGTALERLTPAVDNLRSASIRGRRVMRELDGFTGEAKPLLGELGTFADSTTSSVPRLDAFLRQYRPFATYTKPYTGELGAMFSTFAHGFERFGVGQVPRLMPLINESTYAGATGEQKAAYDALLKLGALDKFRSRSRNAYPRPGTIGDPKPFTGRFPRVTADP